MDPEPTGIPLSRAQRWVASVIAASLLGLGGVAVFRSANDASTVGLLVGGALFSIVALTGYAPARIRVGGNELELGRAVKAFKLGAEEEAEAIVSEVVKRLATQPSRTEPESFLPRIRRRASPAPSTDPDDYERQVLDAIADVLPKGAKLVRHPPNGMAKLDGLIEVEGRRIGVDVRAGSRFHPEYVLGRIAIKFADPKARLDGLFMVIHAPSDDPATETLRSEVEKNKGKLSKPVVCVTWRPGEPTDTLRDALRSWVAAKSRES